MIYKGKRIAKIRNWDIEQGDIGYLKDSELKYVITDVRFLLGEVIYWDRFMGEPDDEGQYYKGYNNERIVSIVLKNDKNFFIIENLEKFDLIMEQFNSSKMLFRQQ